MTATTIYADVPKPENALRAFDAVNLFVAGTLAGFGPFVALFLTQQGWPPGRIGFALTAGTVSGLLAPLPGGELLDRMRSKTLLLAVGIGIIGLSALMIGLLPSFPVVIMALVLQGMSAATIGLGIPAISLGLVGHAVLAERLGRNQRFQSGGSLMAAALMGTIGYFFSNRVIFFASALLVIPALVALRHIRSTDIHFGQSVGAPDHHEAATPRLRRLAVFTDRSLLIFASILLLFQMANGSVLPLISEALAQAAGGKSSLILSALIVIPQILVVVVAPWIGRQAKSWGRRPLLLIGTGALPARAFLLAAIGSPVVVTLGQILDGVTGAVLGVVQPLVVADLTRGSGRFNLAQGFVAAMSGIGASLSTFVSGLIHEVVGPQAAIFGAGCVALIAFLVCLALMPETKPVQASTDASSHR
jgi:MFS family permease